VLDPGRIKKSRELMIDAEYQIFFKKKSQCRTREKKSKCVESAIGLVGLSPSPQMEPAATIEGFCQSLTRKQDRIPKKLLPSFPRLALINASYMVIF